MTSNFKNCFLKKRINYIKDGGYLDVISNYATQINPIQEDYIAKNGKELRHFINTRADKDTRYEHFSLHKTSPLSLKERWSIDLLKMSLQRSIKPVISCSFGIDSIIDVYLTRKALIEMGRDPTDIQLVWNDTANEFREVRQYQKYITDLWNLKLIITKPKKTLKHIIDGNGGITDDYFFSRKGDRHNGRPLSEKCCGTLKHEPMKRATKENKWDLLIVGLRADESSQRLKAGLRDGEYFFSSVEWKAYVVRPILWWTEKDVWAYVEQENIPFNDLYKMNMIQAYPKNEKETLEKNKDLIVESGLDYEDLIGDKQTQTVDRQQAIILEDIGFKVFTPRTGCMMCPIPVKYGYMQWMRLNHEKVYNAMVYNLGYGEALMNMIPQEVRDEIEMLMGINLTPENIHTYLKEILEVKPCTFDKF